MKCCQPRQLHHGLQGDSDPRLHSLSHNYNYWQKSALVRSTEVPRATTARNKDLFHDPGMQELPAQQTSEAIKKYCAAFPALKKGDHSPLTYLQPPPEWCRKNHKQLTMNKIDITFSKDRRNERQMATRERRNSHRIPKKSKGGKKRCYSYSYDSKENLPEWVTNESVWDAESQDPVRAFIRALAFGESCGKCDITADFRMEESSVPDWSDVRLLDEWAVDQPCDLIEDDYAKFEAKFDSSIEALWADPSEDSPLDWRLSSPERGIEDCGFGTDSIWTERAGDASADLHDRLQPLRLADEDTRSAFYNSEAYKAIPAVASTISSLIALNHSKSHSSFVEVVPSSASFVRLRDPPAPPVLTPPACPTESVCPLESEEDLLTSARTHFRPIGELDAVPPPPGVRYPDGTQFDVKGDLDEVTYGRSLSGSLYVESEAGLHRYLEYRGDDRDGIAEGEGLPYSLKFCMEQKDKAVQTEEVGVGMSWDACDECSRLAGAKKMRHVALDSIWSEGGGEGWCGACLERAPADTPAPRAPLADETSQDWEELLADIGRAHARYAAEAEGGGDWGGADRKRRHSALVWCVRGARCPHPHDAPFLHCCTADRPLTR